MYVPPLPQANMLFSCGIRGSLSSCVSLHPCIENSSTQAGQVVMLQCCVSNYEMQTKEGEDKKRKLVHFLMGDRTQSTMGKSLQ